MTRICEEINEKTNQENNPIPTCEEFAIDNTNDIDKTKLNFNQFKETSNRETLSLNENDGLTDDFKNNDDLTIDKDRQIKNDKKLGNKEEKTTSTLNSKELWKTVKKNVIKKNKDDLTTLNKDIDKNIDNFENIDEINDVTADNDRSTREE